MFLAHGYDQNFALNQLAGEPIPLTARTYDPTSGRILEVRTTQPGPVYTANTLDGSVAGSSGTTYRQSDAFALETQHFSNSPYKPSSPTTDLKPGRTFKSTQVYRFSTDVMEQNGHLRPSQADLGSGSSP